MIERVPINMDEYQKELEVLRELSSKFRDIIDKYPQNSREQADFGDWSLKHILAHISGWAEVTLDSFERAKTGEPIPVIDDEDLDEFNKNSVDSRKGRTWDQIYSEFIETEAKLIDEYEAIDPESNNDTLVEFATFSLGWDVDHYQEHLDQIN